MNATGRLKWFWVVLLVAGVYLISGLVSAALAGNAGSSQARQAWRLAAWVISAIVFAAHIYYEQVRLRSSPRTTAWHAALAVGLAGFGLAVSASMHGHATNHPFPVSALVIWPVMTALPAFMVALVVAVVLSRAGHKV
jgi:hypothetical protein